MFGFPGNFAGGSITEMIKSGFGFSQDLKALQNHPKLILENPKTIQTFSQTEDGLQKCPACGGSDTTGEGDVVICNFCRHKFNKPEIDLDRSLDLTENYLGEGMGDISDSEKSPTKMVKCAGCGAELMFSLENPTARCHWCRQELISYEVLSNGYRPDYLIPFSLNKEDAIEIIKAYTSQRKYFADLSFLNTFNPEDVMQTFLPYAVIDINGDGGLKGQGEVVVRTFTKKHGDNRVRYYEVDRYDFEAETDFKVDDLIIEASSNKANINTRENTNNIINAILPFDFTKAIAFDLRYIKEATVENRDLNVEQILSVLQDQMLSIIRYRLGGSGITSYYSHGTRFEEEYVNLQGSRWLSYLAPVWLYSYEDKTGFIHYIAVNGQTGEVHGSIPVNKKRLGLMTFAIFVVSAIILWPLAM